MSFLGSLVSDVLPIAGEIIGGIYGGALGAELGGMLGRSVSNAITGSSSDVVSHSTLPSQAQAIFNSNYLQAFEGAAA
jgi:hypothetical protein